VAIVENFTTKAPGHKDSQRIFLYSANSFALKFWGENYHLSNRRCQVLRTLTGPFINEPTHVFNKRARNLFPRERGCFLYCWLRPVRFL